MINSVKFRGAVHFININGLSLGKSWIVNLVFTEFLIFAKLLRFEIYHFYVIVKLFDSFRRTFRRTFILRFLRSLLFHICYFHSRNMNFNMWEFIFVIRLWFLYKDCTRISKSFITKINLLRTLFDKTLFSLLRNFSFLI